MPRPVPTALAALMVRNGVDALRAFPTVLRTVGTLRASAPIQTSRFRAQSSGRELRKRLLKILHGILKRPLAENK